jgi:hypothetical protein
MTLSPEQRLEQTQENLRKEQRRQIWLPFAGGGLVLLILVVVAALMPGVSVIANVMLTILLLCPAVICLLPIYFLLVFAVFGLNAVYDGAAKPLHRLEKLTATIAAQTSRISDKLARQSINLNTRLAPFSHTLEHAFDERKEDHGKSDIQR